MNGLLLLGVSSVAFPVLVAACSSSVQVASPGTGGASSGSPSASSGTTVATAASSATGSEAGSTSTSTTGASSGKSSSSSAGTGGAGGSRAGCPPALPSTGQACSPMGVTCEYGTDPRVQCRSVVQCLGMNGAAVWLANMMQPCAPIPAGMCPPSPDASGACPQQGLICTYPSGAQCDCDMCVEGPCSQDPMWGCVPPPVPGCPSIAPNTGQPCSPEGLDCRYGNCGAETGIVRECSGGTWQDQPVACAG